MRAVSLGLPARCPDVVKTLVGPGLVVPMDGAGSMIPGGGVLVEGPRIASVGSHRQLAADHPEAAWLNARGMLITPGLINAHDHLYSTFARGIALRDPPPLNFLQVLERLWWRLDKALTLEAVYYSALVGALDALKAGVTTVIDHHSSPNAISGSLDRIAAALREVGLRGCLSYEVSDRDGPERAFEGIEENRRFAAAAAEDDLRRAQFGLHASFTLLDETLRAAREAERESGAGFHLHCAEGPEDQADAVKRYGLRVVQRLRQHGLTGPRTLLAHGVHLDEQEIRLLAETGTFVSHQPHSNMANAVGWSRPLQLRERGVRLALGTDGYTQDLLETLRVATLLHSHQTGLPGAGGAEFSQVLWEGNSRLVSEIFRRPIGTLSPGAAADLVLWDYHPPTPLEDRNFPGHLHFGLHRGLAHTVMVAGQVVLTRGRTRLDEPLAAREARRVARAVWERF